MTQSLSLQSSVSYEILAKQSPASSGTEAMSVPLQLGSGKFAKVYKAWQRSARRNVRPVAIKILHDYASLADERLFKQEIDLLKELTTVSTVNVIRTLDIIHLPPLSMCSCGVLYQPHCPKGCGQALARLERPGHDFPLLSCVRCGYELSAEDIEQRYGELVRPPAKVCCSGPKATRGTLINFVDREAVVMELVEHGLPEVPMLRREALGKMGALPLLQTPRPAGLAEKLRRVLDPDADDLLAQRAVLLEKVFLMVQLAEAVAWLHGEKKIVHKDLAPDNVMVHFAGDALGMSDWSGESTRTVREQLESLGSFPAFSLKVIDFGLADKDELSRSWYEEQDVTASTIKLPYLSPEARRRKERVPELLEFSTGPGGQPCFRVPPSILGTYLSVLPGDLLADSSDSRHDHDLEITRIEPAPDGGGMLAFFRGTPAPRPAQRQYEIVRRLGEPHDVYAVGALFYFILTGRHEEADRLSSLVNLLQEDRQRELVLPSLQRDTYYVGRRSAIPEPFLRDEIMLVILRAMVRGRAHSFVHSRIDRGPSPAQALLRETRRLHHMLERQALAAGLRGRVTRVGVSAAVAASLLTALLAVRAC